MKQETVQEQHPKPQVQQAVGIDSPGGARKLMLGSKGA